MSEGEAQARIEVVGGQSTPEQAEAIVAFWLERGAPDEATARQLLPQVMSLLYDEESVLAGTSVVTAAQLELIGNQFLWIHQPVVRQGMDGAVPPLVSVTFDALQHGFDPESDAPIGFCQLIGDPMKRRLRRQAEWQEPRSHFAGYLPGGVQVRVSYFTGARIRMPARG